MHSSFRTRVGRSSVALGPNVRRCRHPSTRVPIFLYRRDSHAGGDHARVRPVANAIKHTKDGCPTDRPTDRDAEIVIPRVELELEPRLCVCVSYVRSQSLVSRSRISIETGYDRTFGTNAIVPRATASASFQHTTRRLQCPRSSLPLSSAASPPSRRPRFKYVFRACFRDARAVEDDAETAR